MREQQVKENGVRGAGRLPLLLLLAAAAGCGGERGFGVGFVVGGPTGLALKGWLDAESSVSAAVGWPKGGVALQADYVLHNFRALEAKKGEFALYAGVGGLAWLWDAPTEDQAGVRFPLGIDYIVEGGQVDIFLEVVPTLLVSPATDFVVDAAFGVRFFFK